MTKNVHYSSLFVTDEPPQRAGSLRIVTNSDTAKDDSDDSRSADLDLTGVVEPALLRALTLAADAGRLDLVTQLAAELAARRAKPDHAAAQALVDAVLRGLRAGDLVASRAAARALSVLVDALTDTAAPGQAGRKRRHSTFKS